MLASFSLAVTEFARFGPGWAGHGGPGPGFWPIFPLTWLVIWAAIITTVVLLWRRRSRLAPPQLFGSTRSAQALLAERYARGEVTDEEYRQRLETLREKPE
ncbi:SHOCT domain-containing protein [Fodinicola feengrottensis]|uniref:SHOCT domain-containing protein n=1 Tax=Fodinicola feengrottensis TaxID=435914 RepID=A0ABN2J6D0_9ACTN|nr:SHOCT domain-containing protein [Fodinicola feengrottensis]